MKNETRGKEESQELFLSLQVCFSIELTLEVVSKCREKRQANLKEGIETLMVQEKHAT